MCPRFIVGLTLAAHQRRPQKGRRDSSRYYCGRRLVQPLLAGIPRVLSTVLAKSATAFLEICREHVRPQRDKAAVRPWQLAPPHSLFFLRHGTRKVEMRDHRCPRKNDEDEEPERCEIPVTGQTAHDGNPEAQQ